MLLATGSWAAPRPVDPLALPAGAVIARTLLSGDVTGGPERESVALVEYLATERKEQGVGLVLGVYAGEGSARRLLWSRDYSLLSGGFAAGGTLSLLDLDGDDRPEIIVTWHRRDRADVVEESAEILRAAGDGFEPVWNGTMKVDTSTAQDVPEKNREHYLREIDVGKTVRTHGGLIYFRKMVTMAAGIPIDPPREVEESFPLGLNVQPAVTAPAPGSS